MYIYINIPPRIWSPFGINMGHSGEEFWEARGGLHALLGVVWSCGFTLSPKEEEDEQEEEEEGGGGARGRGRRSPLPLLTRAAYYITKKNNKTQKRKTLQH